MTDERVHVAAQRRSFLARMRNEAQGVGGSEPIRRVHLIVAIDRFLARLPAATEPGTWIIKGGYANQLRAPLAARFTDDVDLRIDAPLDRCTEIVAQAASADLDDLLSFEVGAPRPLPGPPGGGLRFPVTCLLAGSELVAFVVDLNGADVMVGEPELHQSDPMVARLGLPRSTFPVYPLAQQFAEKLHAFTMPRSQENTRVKDLADLVWYIERYRFDSAALRASCEATFRHRLAHAWPPVMPELPAAWEGPYRRYRSELVIHPATPAEARDLVASFLVPIVAGDRGLSWVPGTGWSG